MRCRSSIPALAAVAICLAFGSPAQSQGRRGGGMSRPVGPPRQGRSPNSAGRSPNPTGRGTPTPIEEFETMPPEQRQKALNRLPPEERQKLQERLDRFNQLPPERQQALKNLYNRLHELPPDRQNAVRQSINKFSQMPQARQQAIRGELTNMANMSQRERKTHVSTPEFRQNFTKKEQEVVRDMSEVLPPE
jgi:Protein of unknown function (DUF3106)